MNIANQSGLNFRADLNNALAALVSNSSGSSEPTTTYAFQFWVDTSGGYPILKMRNVDNDAWIEVGRVDIDGIGLRGITSGTAEPDALPYQFWVDTSGANPILKYRNGANSAWITVGRADLAAWGLMPLTGGTFSAFIDFSNTDYMKIPVGTTAQRPASPADGMIRYNTDLSTFEGYRAGAWGAIGGGGYVVSSTQTVSAGGSVSSSTTDQRQLRPVQGNAAAVSLSATPFGSGGGWKDGTEITLVGVDDTNSVTLAFNDAAKGAVGNFSEIEITKYKQVTCVYSSTLDRWLVK